MEHRCMVRFLSVLWISLILVGFSSCGGGGGGGDGVIDRDDDSGQDTGGGPVSGEVSVWNAQAAVAVDGCGERIHSVTQTFTVVRNGDTVTVNDTLVPLSGIATDDGFNAGFDAVSGECRREYDVQFSAMTDTTAVVRFTVRSTCGVSICQNEWIGTATRDLTARENSVL